MATRRPFDLPYMVEQWDDADSQVEELALTVITGLRGRHMRKAVKRWAHRDADAEDAVACGQSEKELGHGRSQQRLL
jgi:hypothetical protein